MFTFNILSYPWEEGIEPDAKNENASIWIENYFTKSLRKHPLTHIPIEGLQTSFVALCRHSDGEVEWLLMDENGVFDHARGIDALGTTIDKWRIIHKYGNNR